MKLKNGFVLRELAGECVVVTIDSSLNLDGMMTLNDTARTLWLALEKGAEMDELVDLLTEEYEVDRESAHAGAVAFVERLKELDFLA